MKNEIDIYNRKENNKPKNYQIYMSFKNIPIIQKIQYESKGFKMNLNKIEKNSGKEILNIKAKNNNLIINPKIQTKNTKSS